MTPQNHPSYLELDRFLLGGELSAEPGLRQHLQRCSRCAEYLSGLRDDKLADPAPEWLAALAAPVPPNGSRPRAQPIRQSSWFQRQGARRGRLGLAMLAASAAALLLLWRPLDPAHDAARPRPDEGAALRTKGEPMVAVYVKRADKVWLWDGRSSLRPGDRLRLKITASGYEYVAVGAPTGPPRHLQRLYAGAVSGPDDLLPASWVVDAEPAPEVLYVFLNHQPLPQELPMPPGQTLEKGWCKTLILPKAPPDAPAP